MRRPLVVLTSLLFARAVFADAKTQQLAAGYERETRSCKIQGGGVAKVLEGAKALLEDAHDDALEADVAKLTSARDAAQAYCGELAATIELLRADPDATYKSLQSQISEHDNKIRALRKASKDAVDGVG